jgi:hypothetical protein
MLLLQDTNGSSTNENMSALISQLVKPHALALLSKFGSRLTASMEEEHNDMVTCTKIVTALGHFLSFLQEDTFNVYPQVINYDSVNRISIK